MGGWVEGSSYRFWSWRNSILKPQRDKPNPLSCPEGALEFREDTWWYKKHKNKDYVYVKIVNWHSLPQWYPDKDYGKPIYPEPGKDVIQKKRSCTGTERGLHVYSYIGVKRPWDMQRPKVSLFCVLIKWHGNTCRCWKGWKDSVQATQNLPKNHFFYPNPWMCFISDQLHATFKNLTSQNRISIKAMHECAPSQALKVEYPGTAHMSPLRCSL